MNFFGKILNEINTLPALEKKVFFVVDVIYFYGINNPIFLWIPEYLEKIRIINKNANHAKYHQPQANNRVTHIIPSTVKRNLSSLNGKQTKWDTLIHKEINFILSSFLILKLCEIVRIAFKYICHFQGSRSWWSYSRPFVDPNLVNADDKRYGIHQSSYKTVFSLLCISLVHILNKQK